MTTVAPGQVSRTYTILLFLYGVVSLLVAFGLRRVLPGLGGEEAANLLLHFYTNLAFGAAALLVALLRHLRGAASLPLSNVLSLALAIEIPLGTALFIYWLAKVRKTEHLLPAAPKPVRWYTTGLFIAAIVFLTSAGAFRFLSGSEGPDDLLRIMATVYVGLSALLAVVGIVRSVSPRWGYYATFGLSIVLLPLLPVGTVASLLWFRKVRPLELAPVPQGA
jgi:hypothetical protein